MELLEVLGGCCTTCLLGLFTTVAMNLGASDELVIMSMSKVLIRSGLFISIDCVISNYALPAFLVSDGMPNGAFAPVITLTPSFPFLLTSPLTNFPSFKVSIILDGESSDACVAMSK